MAILDDQAYLILEKEEDICLFLGNTDERYYSTIWKRQQKQSFCISFFLVFPSTSHYSIFKPCSLHISLPLSF